jgi:hypothetical protein
VSATITGAAPRAASSGRVTWSQVQPGFYVASRAGEFIGYIDRTPAGQHVAFDGRSTPVGRFDSLDAAKRAVTTDPQPQRAERAWRHVAVATGTMAGMLALTAGAVVPFV